MTLFLTDTDVRAAFDWRPAVEALRAAYAVDVDDRRYPPRSVARGETSWLRVLSGVAAGTGLSGAGLSGAGPMGGGPMGGGPMGGGPMGGGLMGAKLIAAAPRHGRAAYLIPLFDETTAELTALLDGHAITGFRTAATSALAAGLLTAPSDRAPAAGPDVAVIGSGFEARHHLRALLTCHTPSRVRVHSPNAGSRSDFARAFPGVEAVPSAEEAVRGAGLIVCAARSRDESPTLLGRWLSPGVTVLSIGSTLPEQREVDPEVIARADLVVADMPAEVVHDTGDMIAAAAAGVDVSRTVPLADVVAGRHPGRTADGQIVVYKSVGAAVQDIAVAAMCVERARELGLGTTLPVTIRPVQK
ncbi:ornithine cyclodeaminase family protein [Actinoplanes sp. NPDC051851]|uniref:ornithine cyclodeaminase family protein n=1 Tax=Actinoplanes sp. NPDC051851 TaxID=3154753 RepID=UPI00343150C0